MKSSILFTTRTSTPAAGARVYAVDSMRGLAMILMTLANIPVQSGNLLLVTQWITYCAGPAFVFLAGVSAWLIQGRRPVRETALFLLKRGCLLFALQLAVFPFGGYVVLPAIGLSMFVLAGLLYLPYSVVLCFGMAVVLGAGLLPREAITESVYPMLPWPGLMALGFCFGTLYTSGLARVLRLALIVIPGCCCCWLFVILGRFSGYGMPIPWLLSLLGSLAFVLMLLAFFESGIGRVLAPLTVFGRVPLFYYLLHLYMIHALLFFGWAVGGTGEFLETGGLVVVISFPLCRWYGRYKQRHPDQWWWSYL